MEVWSANMHSQSILFTQYFSHSQFKVLGWRLQEIVESCQKTRGQRNSYKQLLYSIPLYLDNGLSIHGCKLECMVAHQHVLIRTRCTLTGRPYQKRKKAENSKITANTSLEQPHKLYGLTPNSSINTERQDTYGFGWSSVPDGDVDLDSGMDTPVDIDDVRWNANATASPKNHMNDRDKRERL